VKVAIFVTNDLTTPNAESLLVNEPLKHLIKFEDLEVHLIAPNDIPDELKDGLKYIRYTIYNKPILRFLSAFSAIPKLLKEDYDLYHSRGQKATSILLIVRLIKRKQTPILHVGFEITKESKIRSKHSIKNKILERFFHFSGTMALRYSQGMYVYTEALKNYIQEHGIYNNRIFVVPIAVDLDLFGREHERDLTLINELGLKDKKVIVYTGEITPLHGILDLVKAMHIVNSKIKDAVLVIVGDGSALLEIKEYVNKNKLHNVIFVGRVVREKIQKYHSIADVLVIPHIRRIDSELIYPSKLLECLASGKPVVASNLKAIANVVGDNAVLVEPEKPEAFANGILRLLNDRDLAEKIGENGKRISYKYSWEESAQKLYEAYKYFEKN
jgi:glycosyltransferase involved in cell wall biosynthesis